jgi:hypothetical protein
MVEGSACTTCPIGTYSLVPNATDCSQCPLQATCLGGDRISVNPGFWRYNRETIMIYPCKNTDACPGGYLETGPTPVPCAEGYKGYLCTKC